MTGRILSLRYSDIVEAVENVGGLLRDVSLVAFEGDWRKRWLVERGIEIISEASRHIPDEVKAAHPTIPWVKVAGIGNVLRHAYHRSAPDILWKLVQDDLPPLATVCRAEFEAAIKREKGG